MSDSGDSLAQLRDDIATLQQTVAHLQERIHLMETQRATQVLPAAPPPTVPAQNPSVFGLVAVNRVGALTLAIGIIFFFKYAVENQWIGIGGRLLSGVVVGALLIGIGEWITRRGNNILAQGVAGCGIATLYITVYAAFGYYGFLSQSVAFVAFLMVCTCAVVLSFRYGYSAIATIGFTGALLTPVLLSPESKGGAGEVFYIFLLDAIALSLSVRQGWKLPVPEVGALALLVAWIRLDSHHGGWVVLLSLLLATTHLVATRFVEKASPLFNVLYLTGSGCLVIAGLRELELWTRNNFPAATRGNVASALGSVLLGVYGILALAYSITRQSTVNRLLGLVLLGMVMAKLYLWDIWFLQRVYRTAAFVGLGVLLLVASGVYSRWRSPSSGQ